MSIPDSIKQTAYDESSSLRRPNPTSLMLPVLVMALHSRTVTDERYG